MSPYGEPKFSVLMVFLGSEPGSLAMHSDSILTSRGCCKNGRKVETVDWIVFKVSNLYIH